MQNSGRTTTVGSENCVSSVLQVHQPDLFRSKKHKSVSTAHAFEIVMLEGQQNKRGLPNTANKDL